jgi:serralysin
LGVIASGGAISIGNDARNLAVSASEVDFVSIDSSTDTDFFSFTVSDSGSVTVNLEALGVTYNIGPQSGGSSSFNTAERSDLQFDLLASDGTTVLASLNGAGLGSNEALTDFNLSSAGTYFLRVAGTDNPDSVQLDAQFYGLTVNFTAVPEPSTILLLGMSMFGSVAYRRFSVRR